MHSIRGRFEAKQETRSSVYEQGTVHPCGSGSGLRGPLTGCLARTHRASAPKPTRMAVGLTRDCRETLRREVQGSSESSTRRSAYSKRHVGAPNRRTKQVKLLVDHRCSGVTVRNVARYQKPSRTPHTRVTGSRPTCLSVALQLSLGSSAWVTAWAASGCGCTETCPVTRDLRAFRRRHVPVGRSGRLRGARSLEVSFHRPLVRRAGWRLVPACGNKEVDAYRSIDELARSGGYWVEALHRSHIESGDFMGASRPRARSVPRTSVWGRPLGTGVQVGGRGVYLWFAKPSQPAWGGSWQSARAVLVDHRYTPRRASDPSLVPLHALLVLLPCSLYTLLYHVYGGPRAGHPRAPAAAHPHPPPRTRRLAAPQSLELQRSLLLPWRRVGGLRCRRRRGCAAAAAD